eukprot:665557-Prorocentrum_lima.AAC.1
MEWHSTSCAAANLAQRQAGCLVGPTTNGSARRVTEAGSSAVSIALVSTGLSSRATHTQAGQLCL